ncbi:MAG: hypothetical protein M1840_000052 [Geoglossum simile]|nr:MAG: hypothetical protein M1840_000052 [Geoglossum simile]
MAEVLAIASGIAGLLSLTIEVYSISARYISCVKNASSAVGDVLRELKSLKTILTELDKVTEHMESEKVFQERSSSLLSVDDSEEYREVLERLRVKMLKQASQTGFSAKMKNFAWPFSEERTQCMVDLLRRHVGIFGQALTIDTFFTTSQVLKEVRSLGQDKREKKTTKVLEWLSSVDMQPKQQDILSRRQSGTGEWLLCNECFIDWMDNDSVSLLWCPGDPGVGKTVLTSIVVNHISNRCTSSDAAVAFLYCDYQDQSFQTASSLIANLVKQFVLLKDTFFKPLEELYENLTQGKMKPNLKDLESLILSICKTFGRSYIVIDALDECSPDQRKLLLTVIRNFQRASIKIFVTSRQHAQDVERAFSGHARIEIKATEPDLRAYIEHQIEDDEDLMDLLPEDLRVRIVSTIAAGAGGMFLYAVLQIKRIRDQMTIREVKRALETMPNGISELYTETLQRIRKQSPRRSKLGMTVLAWISYAKRPMLVDELRHALAAAYIEGEDQQRTMDMDNLIQAHLLVDVCAGLVTMEDESQVIRLVHYTTQEYFSRQTKVLFPDTQLSIAGTCLTYLLFDEFRSGPCFGEVPLNERRKQFRFLEYASCYWGHHIRGQLETKFLDMILEFLKDDKRVCAAAEVASTCEPELFRWCNKFGESPEDFQPLAVAASQGLDTVVNVLLDQNMDPSKADGTFKTPAHWAAWRGHASTLGHLLKRGVDLQISSDDGFTLLDAACDQGQETVVHLLLDKGFDVNTQGFGEATGLEIAASCGHERLVKLLLDNGADWELKTVYNETPLMKAAMNGYEGIVRMLLGKGAEIKSANACGNTALHCASFYGREDMVQILLQSGADANERSSNGGIPLHMAASQGREQVVRLLLERGADIEAKTEDKFDSFKPLVESTGRCIPQMVRLNLCAAGSTALNEAVLHGQEGVVNVLIGRGANVNAPGIGLHTPLMTVTYSAMHNNKGGNKLPLEVTTKAAVAIAQSLLENGADIYSESVGGWLPIHFAAWYDALEILQLLLAKGLEVDAKNAKGETPLHCACRRGHIGIVDFLLENGADVNAVDEESTMATHWACQSGKVDVIGRLLDRNIDIEATDGSGRTFLMRAVWSLSPVAVQFLVDRGADIEHSLKGGQTPLVFAVWAKDRTPIIPVLLKAGARFDFMDSQGFQALHRAALQGNAEAVELLVAAGAGIESEDARGDTPLVLAASRGQVEVIQALLGRGAKVEHGAGGTRTALMSAAEEEGGASACEMLLKGGADIHATTVSGITATHKAAMAGNVNTLKVLLAAGGTGEPKDNLGNTPLHLAVWHGHLAAVDELLDSAADVELTNPVGKTSLHFATQQSHESIVHLLLARGANPDPRCISNETPMLLAAKSGQADLVEMLLSTGKVDINWKSKGGESALYMAVDACHTDTVRVLLENGSDPNLRTSTRCLPAHRAAEYGDEDILRLLLGAGADPQATDARDCTVLMWAAQFGGPGIVRMLLETNRVDVNAVAVDGDTALHCAAIMGHVEVLELLLEHGGLKRGIRNNDGLTAREIAVDKQFWRFVGVCDGNVTGAI